MRDYKAPRRTCKFCGEECLYWAKGTKGWRLVDEMTNKPHRCQDTWAEMRAWTVDDGERQLAQVRKARLEEAAAAISRQLKMPCDVAGKT